MKLFAYKQNIEFLLEENKINHLVIENPEFLDGFVKSLDESYRKLNCDVELMDKELLELHKYSYILYSPLECHYDKKEILKELYISLIAMIESSPLAEEYLKMKTNILQMLEEIILHSEYEIEGEEDLNLETFLKNFNIHLKTPEGNFPERLIEFSIHLHRLLGKKMIILVGCQQYISNTAYEEIFKQLNYEGIILLMIDGFQLKELNIEVNEYIIDSDLCELY